MQLHPLRLTSRLIVQAERCKERAINRNDCLVRNPLDISSRSVAGKKSALRNLQ